MRSNSFPFKKEKILFPAFEELNNAYSRASFWTYPCLQEDLKEYTWEILARQSDSLFAARLDHLI
jgi:hypothetical protein